jgi:hypothetical protein
VTGSTGPGAVWTSATSITVPAYSLPPNGRQPNAATLDALDGRFQATVFQVGNVLYACHAVNVSSHSAIRWYEIDATTSAVILSGTISDTNFDFTQPSIAANAAGYIVIGATRSGTSNPAGLPGAYAWVGTPGSGTVNFTAATAPIQLKAGEASYGSGGVQRWGDYSATNVDPADPQIFWTTQEYGKSPNPTWGTQISELIVPLPNETRWADTSSGSLTFGPNYLNGVPPTTVSHAIFSREGNPYTVTILGVGGSTVNDRASFRQGSVTLNLNSGIYTLQNANSATPSVAIAEYNGIANATFTNGSISSVNALMAGGNISVASVSLSSMTWNNSGSMSIGGSAISAGGAATLSIDSSSLNVGGRLKVWNNATVNYNSGTLNAGSVDITAGQILLSSGKDKAIVASGVSIAGGGKIDIADNFMIVNYSVTSPQPALAALITNGYNSGNWTGTNSITSSTAAANVGSANPTAIGYADSVALGSTSFAGRTLSSPAVLIRYTLSGDSDLSGTVDLTDFTYLAANFNTLGTSSWLQGDYNYDGNTDLTDFTFLAANFNQTVPASLAGAVVPEPLAMSLLTGLLALRRRRAVDCSTG